MEESTGIPRAAQTIRSVASSTMSPDDASLIALIPIQHFLDIFFLVRSGLGQGNP